MRTSIRGVLVSAGATAVLVLAQAGTAAATVSEVNTPSYESCPGVISGTNPSSTEWDWTVSFNCTATVKVNTGGRVANAKGSVTGAYAQWSTSTGDPCPPGGSPFTTTVSMTYTDHHGSIAFSAPMEVLGSNSAGPNGTTQTWCYSQYNISYASAQAATGSGRYAGVNTMCGFELGVETDAPGGTLYFDANGSNGTCAPYA